ncbi:unnamed protein product [Bathycoccus prasinos]
MLLVNAETWSHRGYFEKLECSKGLRLNILAWNNTIGLLSYLVGLGMGVMIKRNSWGHSYFIVRGEILGFMKDEIRESICQGCFH